MVFMIVIISLGDTNLKNDGDRWKPQKVIW